jgi:short-subunit dehydrogenase
MKELKIITGGSSGLGFCISRRLVEQGHNVAIIGRDKQKLQSAKEQMVKGSSAQVIIFCGNVADEDFVKRMFDIISNDGFLVTGLYNCAGFAKFGAPEATTRKMIDSVFDGSLTGTILMSAHAMISMREHGGVIVNIMSSAALRGNANESVYCAAKWGARGYTEALKAFVKGSSIKVIGVYPGGMNTPFWKPDSGVNPDTSKFMNPEEVAEQILSAVSPKNTMYVSDISIERR